MPETDPTEQNRYSCIQMYVFLGHLITELLYYKTKIDFLIGNYFQSRCARDLLFFLLIPQDLCLFHGILYISMT